MQNENTVSSNEQANKPALDRAHLPAQAGADITDRSFVSVGQHIHNEFTYRGIDLFLNACFGIAFTVVTHRTEMGRKYFTNPVEGFFTRAFKPIFKNTKSLKESVHWGVNFLSIMFGGTAIIPAVMALEKKENKHAIVSAIDHKIYGKEAVEQDPKFVQSYQKMDNLPNKDFSMGMVARIVALAPLIASTLHIPTHNKITKYWYDPIGKGLRFITNKIGIKEKGFLGKVSAHGNSAGAESSNLEYMIKIASFDIGLTAFYSFLHEFSYKFFARKEDDHRIKKATQREQRQTDGISYKDTIDEETNEKELTPDMKQPQTQVTRITHEQLLAAPALHGVKA